VIYHCYLHGGPLDGEMNRCFRPYEQLDINGSTYKAKENPPDHVEWVDDETSRIDLYYDADIALAGS